ncbi:helix-turn-helix domain-containing protein [Modestobacter sp. SYSU DS0875]
MSAVVQTVGVRLRQVRQARGLSVVALGERAGISRATLTQLEAGSGNPTLETLYALANALDVPLTALIEPPPQAESMVVLRRGEGTLVEGTTLRAVLLAHCRSEGMTADLYSLTVPSRTRTESAPHPPGTTEHLHVQSGTLHVGTPARSAELGPGDYARFDGSLPHHYAAGDSGANATLLITSTTSGPHDGGAQPH